MSADLLQKSIRQIELGDFLAEDIVDVRGKLILPKGTALEPAHAKMLKKNRIFTVKVGSESAVVGTNLERDGGMEELERMFKRHADNARMQELYQAVKHLREDSGNAT